MTALIGWTLLDQTSAAEPFTTETDGGVARVLWSDPPSDARARLRLFGRAFAVLDAFLPASDSALALDPQRREALVRRMQGHAQLSIGLRVAQGAKPGQPGNGRAYLRARQAAQRQQRAMCAQMVETLSTVMRDQVTDRRVLSFPTDVHAHYLVRRSEADHIRSDLVQMLRTHPSCSGRGQAVVTGPWPASAAVWAEGSGRV